MNHDVVKARSDLKNALSMPVDSSRPIAIFGAGDTAALYAPLFLDKTYWKNGFPVCFIDDTLSKHGNILYDMPIISFSEAQERCKGYYVLICTLGNL